MRFRIQVIQVVRVPTLARISFILCFLGAFSVADSLLGAVHI